MLAYDELVDALAAWRSRQGLAETGSDYLGPAPPFPEYRVAQPSSDRAYTESTGEDVYEAEEQVAEEYVAEEYVAEEHIAEEHIAEEHIAEEYAAEGSYEAMDELGQEASAEVYAAEGSYEAMDEADVSTAEFPQEAAPEQVGGYDEPLESEAQAAEQQESDLDETGPYDEASMEVIEYDDPTDANIDAARLAADDVGGMDEAPEHYDAETLIAEEYSADEDEAAAVETAPSDYVEQEATAIGVGIDELAPAVSDDEDDLKEPE